MNLESLKVKISLVALFYFLIVDYKYFGIFFIIYFIIFGINFTTNTIEENLFRLLPILFYLKKFILGFSDRYSELWTKTSLNDFYLQSKFPDINIDILQYKCQYFLDSFQKSYFVEINNCPMGNYRYGPLHHLIQLNLDPNYASFLWIGILSGLSLFAYLKITNKNKDLIPLISIILLSPIVNMAYHQFNMDIFLVISSYYLLKNIDKFTFPKIILLTSIALIKQHPVALLFGLGYVFFINKKSKKLTFIIINLFCFITVNFILFNDLNLLSGQPRPSNMYNSSGLLTFSQYLWVNIFNEFGSYRYVLFIYILIFLATILYGKTFIVDKKSIIQKMNHRNLEKYYPFIIWFLFAGSYANYDYRNLILIVLSVFILKNTDKLSVTVYLILIMSSPFPSFLPGIILTIMSTVKFLSYLYIYSLLFFIALKPIAEKIKLDKKIYGI
jgi:hypothetical protein